MSLQNNPINGRRKQRAAWAALLVAGYCGLFAAGTCRAEEENRETFRVALASNIFPEVRDSDTVASIMTWGDAVFSARDLDIKTIPTVYHDTASIKEAVRLNQTELVAISSVDFFDMQDDLQPDRILAYLTQGKITTEYLLLVRRSSGLDDLASLRGKSFMFGEYEKQGMGWIWLETLLMQEQSREPSGYFDSVTSKPKTSRAVLSVFFGKGDVCLATRSSFDTMVELNPQIGKMLKPLAVSPPFVPALLCMRKSYDAPQVHELYEAVKNLSKNPKAAQMLTIFGVDDVVEASLDDLATVREWTDTHTALKKSLNQKDVVKVQR